MVIVYFVQRRVSRLVLAQHEVVVRTPEGYQFFGLVVRHALAHIDLLSLDGSVGRDIPSP